MSAADLVHPWRERAKLLEGRAAAAHVGCCVFFVLCVVLCCVVLCCVVLCCVELQFLVIERRQGSSNE